MGASTSRRSPSVSRAAGRSVAGTNSPLTAVATTAPPYPSSASAPDRSAARISCEAPLTRIRMYHLGRMACAEHLLRRMASERRGEEKAVPIQAVHIHRIAAPLHARQIVGKSGPHTGADLDDLRLAERRVQGIGRA